MRFTDKNSVDVKYTGKYIGPFNGENTKLSVPLLFLKSVFICVWVKILSRGKRPRNSTVIPIPNT